MKKTILYLLLLFSSMLSIGQTQNKAVTVSGRITDGAGNAVPFATVKVKNSKTGAAADADGNFTIRLQSGSILIVTAQGMLDKEVVAEANNQMSIVLAQDTKNTLTEVVITGGFGIKKSARTSPFSSQAIKSEQLNTIRQTNLNNALAGKVAGVQFRGQSSVAIGREGFLRIRGGQSLGDRSAIYVVDGTITSSQDINPDDVEDITVLKGANATALLGALAANGAIMITTKKKNAGPGIGVEFNQSVTFDRVNIIPKYQDLYAGGAVDNLTPFVWKSGMPVEWKALDGKGFHDYTDDASWGPRMDGQEYIPWYAWYPGSPYSYKTASLTPQPNNMRDFWEKGVTTNTNISFSKAGIGSRMRLSYTNQAVKGLLPNTSSQRHNLNLTTSMEISNQLSLAVNVNYSTLALKGDINNDGYANQSSGSFNQWFHRDLDIKKMRELKDLKSPFGTLASWNTQYNPDGYNPAAPNDFYQGNYWYNFYAYFENIKSLERRDRFFGDVSLTYKVNNNFKVKGTIRKNQDNRKEENIVTSLLEQSGAQTGVLAGYNTAQDTRKTYDYELLGSFNKTFGGFAVTANIGGNDRKYDRERLASATVGGLSVPDFYAINNSKNPAAIANIRQKTEIRSVFASGDVEYNRFASLTWAVRNDWYSTLPVGNNRLLSPSVGASFVFSEFTKNKLPWLNFGKVFGSWGRKPLDLDVYATNFLYPVGQFQYNGNFLMTTPNQLPDPGLTGSLITTYEMGIDLRFLKNRLGVNLVYYSENNNGEPLTVTVTGASGFTSKVVNSAEFSRQGIELLVTSTPISQKNFSWDLNTNFSYLIKNPVNKLIEGTTRIPVPLPADLPGQAFGTRGAIAYHQLGMDWGQLVGGAYKRNAEGQIVINPATGLYVTEVNQNFGSAVPKYTGGVSNMFRYKNFNLNFNIDYQFGGKFYSLSEMWGHFSGLLEATAATNDKGKNVRDNIASGGGVKVEGVSSVDNKTPVTKYVDAQTYFHQFYFSRLAEPFIHSLSFVKLREVSLGYNIPVHKLGKMGKVFQSANFSVIARSPWIIYRETQNFDPSEISNVYGEAGQFPGTRSIGFNLKLVF